MMYTESVSIIRSDLKQSQVITEGVLEEYLRDKEREGYTLVTIVSSPWLQEPIAVFRRESMFRKEGSGG